jgi:DNA-binding GntR family transcriptional regulator
MGRVPPPGQWPVAKEIASRLGFILALVREGIREVKQDGLVRGEPSRGSVVTESPSLKEMEEFSCLRSALAELVASFAAKPRSEATLVDFERRWAGWKRGPATGPEGGRS